MGCRRTFLVPVGAAAASATAVGSGIGAFRLLFLGTFLHLRFDSRCRLLLCPEQAKRRLLFLRCGNGELISRRALALAIADDLNILFSVHLGGVRIAVQHHLHLLSQQLDLVDHTHAVWGVDQGFQFGRVFEQVFIGVLLVFQAAHEAAADAGDFGGVEGDILGLGHLDGHRLEVTQKLRTAERTSADAQATHDLRLVSDADLPQLDAGAEDGRQVFDQVTEIHPAIGGEEEQNLAAVEAVLHFHQLHFQLVLGNFVLANLEGFFLLLLVGLHLGVVLLRGHAEHGTQSRDQLHLVDHGVGQGALAKLDALGCLYDHVLSGLHLDAVGVKVI